MGEENCVDYLLILKYSYTCLLVLQQPLKIAKYSKLTRKLIS